MSPFDPGEAIRGSSRSSAALDPQLTAQTDPNSPLPGRDGRASKIAFINLIICVRMISFQNVISPMRRSARRAGPRGAPACACKPDIRAENGFDPHACLRGSFTFSIEQRKTAAKQRGFRCFSVIRTVGSPGFPPLARCRLLIIRCKKQREQLAGAGVASPRVFRCGRRTRSASPKAACWRTRPRRARRSDRITPPTAHAPGPPRRLRP